MKERIAYWDVAKAVAIFLVVWGHCLQNLTTDSSYWLTDRVSQCIISFHMPLFMMISGYFAYSSLRKPLWDVMKKKAIQLLLPSVSWFLIVSVLAMVLHRAFTFERIEMIGVSMLSSYWFLKSLFMCYLVAMIGSVIYQWRSWMLIPYALLIVLCGEWLNYVSTISMLPFFCTGLLLHKYQSWITTHERILFAFSIYLYLPIFLLTESADYNLYNHPFVLEIGGANH